MAPAWPLGFSDVLVYAAGIWLISKIITKVRRRRYATPLQGPPSQNFFFGYQQTIMDINVDGALLYEEWVAQYGSVISVPWSLGLNKIVISDPKAIAHFYARETFGYVQNGISRNAIANLVSICLHPLYAVPSSSNATPVRSRHSMGRRRNASKVTQDQFDDAGRLTCCDPDTGKR